MAPPRTPFVFVSYPDNPASPDNHDNPLCIMKPTTDQRLTSRLARLVPGEDIRPGDFVTVMYDTVTRPPGMHWDCDGWSLYDRPTRYRRIPRHAGRPLEVIGVCLPFVYTRTPDGKVKTLDIRKSRLARLDAECAQTVWDSIRHGVVSP